MSEKTEATLRRRPRSVPFAGLATTRFGRALLLAVAAGAAYLALYQPSWAIDPLRDLVERTMEAFGAGTILVVLWALAFLTLLRYRTGTLFRRWRLVLGSAALVVAVLGGLAYFDGPLPLLDEGNLGGEYGLTIQGDDRPWATHGWPWWPRWGCGSWPPGAWAVWPGALGGQQACFCWAWGERSPPHFSAPRLPARERAQASWASAQRSGYSSASRAGPGQAPAGPTAVSPSMNPPSERRGPPVRPQRPSRSGAGAGSPRPRRRCWQRR